MEKILDLTETVYDLCSRYPEVKDIMVEIGFADIRNPVALQTVGRVMTIPKGATIKGYDLEEIVKKFEAHGFRVIRESEEDCSCHSKHKSTPPDTTTPEGRSLLLQQYITRLTAGEDLKSVRADFLRNFRGVDAAEIAAAEQQLIRGGVPIKEVQRVCDVHSALFHGNTDHEISLNRGKDSHTTQLIHEEGHPLNILYLENVAIDELVKEVQMLLAQGVAPDAMAEKLRGLQTITHHFAKKGDLLYPLLRSVYDIDAPFNVMWGVDDEIRDELHRLCKNPTGDEAWKSRMDAVLTREREMIYKEVNILFALCARHFTDDDWQEVRTEIDGYRPAVIKEYPEWAKHQHTHPLHKVEQSTGTVTLPSGQLTIEQLTAVLNTLPYEITFIDADETNSFFNEMKGEKFFKRPLMALGRKVYDCHPPMVQPMVRRLIESFKAGQSDTFEVWTEKSGHDVLIRYMAVRNDAGDYLGTLESVQIMDFARKHYASKAE